MPSSTTSRNWWTRGAAARRTSPGRVDLGPGAPSRVAQGTEPAALPPLLVAARPHLALVLRPARATGRPHVQPHLPANGLAASIAGNARHETLPHHLAAACAATRGTVTSPAHLRRNAVPATLAGAVGSSRLRAHSRLAISLRDERLVRE
jgi:hypothetical protein